MDRSHIDGYIKFHVIIIGYFKIRGLKSSKSRSSCNYYSGRKIKVLSHNEVILHCSYQTINNQVRQVNK